MKISNHFIVILILTAACATVAGCTWSGGVAQGGGSDIRPIRPGATRAQVEMACGAPIERAAAPGGQSRELYRFRPARDRRGTISVIYDRNDRVIEVHADPPVIRPPDY